MLSSFCDDLCKGVFVSGEIGRGKTTALKTLIECIAASQPTLKSVHIIDGTGEFCQLICNEELCRYAAFKVFGWYQPADRVTFCPFPFCLSGDEREDRQRINSAIQSLLLGTRVITKSVKDGFSLDGVNIGYTAGGSAEERKQKRQEAATVLLARYRVCMTDFISAHGRSPDSLEEFFAVMESVADRELRCFTVDEQRGIIQRIREDASEEGDILFRRPGADFVQVTTDLMSKNDEGKSITICIWRLVDLQGESRASRETALSFILHLVGQMVIDTVHGDHDKLPTHMFVMDEMATHLPVCQAGRLPSPRAALSAIVAEWIQKDRKNGLVTVLATQLIEHCNPELLKLISGPRFIGRVTDRKKLSLLFSDGPPGKELQAAMQNLPDGQSKAFLYYKREIKKYATIRFNKPTTICEGVKGGSWKPDSPEFIRAMQEYRKRTEGTVIARRRQHDLAIAVMYEIYGTEVVDAFRKMHPRVDDMARPDAECMLALLRSMHAYEQLDGAGMALARHFDQIVQGRPEVKGEIHRVEADGHCLFRALEGLAFADARQRVVTWVQQHPFAIVPSSDPNGCHAVITLATLDCPFNEYCSNMRADAWGSELEIFAYSEAYDCQVHLYYLTSDSKIKWLHSTPHRMRSKHVIYNGINHFDRLTLGI